MKLNRGLYFGDFVASPIAIVVLTTVALAHRDFEAAGLWGLTLLAGLGTWTLVEYACTDGSIIGSHSSSNYTMPIMRIRAH